MKELIVFLLMSSSMVYGFVNQDYKKHFDDGYEQQPTLAEMREDVPELFPEHLLSEFAYLSDEDKVLLCKQSNACSKLAEAVVYEARSESRQGMRAVASVIMNRVDSPRFPSTIDGVVTQPYQFSYVGFEHLQQKPNEQDWNTAYVVAYNIKHGLVERLDGVYFYLNKQTLGYKLPRWAIEYTEVETIGMHTFYTW